MWKKLLVLVCAVFLLCGTMGVTFYCDSVCGDVNGDFGVDAFDFYWFLAFYGANTSTADPGQSGSCLDGLCTQDGYLDTNDILAWDLRLDDNVTILTLCALPVWREFMDATGGGASASYSSTGSTAYGNNLLIGGKQNALGTYSMGDGLYVYDQQKSYVGQPFTPITSRGNGRLTSGADNKIYQLNSGVGLTRLNDGAAVVTKGIFAVSDDPRYHDNATVAIGLQNNTTDYAGRAILDAAIDAQGFVYVTPVVVKPSANPSGIYLASAKLELHPGQTPCYSIVRLYDDPPGLNENHDDARMGLHEIEVDPSGNVFVASACLDNSSDFLWAFPADNGSTVKIALDNISGVTGGISDPVALCASKKSSLLYLASGQHSPTDNSTTIYALSTDNLSLTLVRTIQISGMGHVTGITEDPATGTVWVAGFKMENIPETIQENQSPFYHPYLAEVPDNATSAQAGELGSSDAALPVSIVWLAPNDVTLHATLDNFTGDITTVPFTLEVQPDNGSLTQQTIYLDANGDYTLTDVAPDNYTISLKASAYIKETQTVTVDGSCTLNYTLLHAIPGDANCDRSVNSVDYGIVRTNYLKSGMTWEDGDFNGDGNVNSVDYGILREHYLETGP